MVNEVWKDVKGYEGLYQVSNLGHIRSNKKMLSLKNSKGWYLSFRACKNNNQKTLRVHRVVAESENTRHAIIGKPQIIIGMVKYNTELRPKTILQYDLNGSYLNSFINANEASKSTGVCQRNILHVANKQRKQAGGFIWKFIGEN